ncbi:DUF5994 family protein [Nocardia nova]|uniref:DUF5994 family protein n=1 Tax=Nocardia nova TaxID=37330 RepID=UPI0021579F9E|nr:DUF5994 family protein [Nocardia nova]
MLRDREESAGVDGAWWPRTDLTTELHDLVTAPTTRLGVTARITFDWNSLSRSQRGIDPPDGIEVRCSHMSGAVVAAVRVRWSPIYQPSADR